MAGRRATAPRVVRPLGERLLRLAEADTDVERSQSVVRLNDHAVVWQHAGGAIGRVAPDAMAFAHRGISHDTLFIMDWAMGIDATPHIEWLRSYFATVAPYTRGFYTNDLSDESQAAVNKNYAGNYERLVQIKNQYDPTNLFRLNANVVPTV